MALKSFSFRRSAHSDIFSALSSFPWAMIGFLVERVQDQFLVQADAFFFP